MAKTATRAAPVAEEPRPAQAVAKTESALPAFMDAEDMGALSGAGLSGDARDFLLPFLAIAQSNSPQLKKQQQDKYISGLEAGDIFNTATGQFWKGDEGLLVVPAFFQKAQVEWVLRSEGGGYVATHQPEDPIVSTARSVEMGDGRTLQILPNGHQLVETKYHFCITSDGPVVVGLASTGLQVSRQWLTMMKNVKIGAEGARRVAPSFSRQYRLRSVYRTNDSGDWFQFVVEDEGWVTSMDIFSEAKAFYLEAAKSGVVLGRPPEAATATSAGPGYDEDGDVPL